ncbi:MAG: T9SS type A sorting domain-containing protein [Bacteroidia bacterium]|nr:T9SS type A sorting domain-containing protein [Bacteroidia bacterium]NNL79164.1 T9SS type A sorting domain-containing protein [Flavobacteriaceae bacterium]
MKKNYTQWLLLSLLLTTSLSYSQSCPETLGASTSNVLIHFDLDNTDCTDYPGSITVQGRTFDKSSCTGTSLKYQLVAGTPLPLADSFSVDLGFGECDYLNGELRRETLSVDAISETINSLRIYPNPITSGDYVNLGFSQNITADVTVYDLTGKAILTEKISSSSTKSLNISTVNDGIYMLRIEAENSATSRKFVIMR